jgi:hypothetical protein
MGPGPNHTKDVAIDRECGTLPVPFAVVEPSPDPGQWRRTLRVVAEKDR